MKLNLPLKFTFQTYSTRNSQQTGRIKQTCIKIMEHLTKHSYCVMGYQCTANHPNCQQIDHKPSYLKWNSFLIKHQVTWTTLNYSGFYFCLASPSFYSTLNSLVKLALERSEGAAWATWARQLGLSNQHK